MTYFSRDGLEQPADLTARPADGLAEGADRRFAGPSQGNGPAAGAASADELQARLADSDLEMIRVLEDLITVLIDKRVIMLTDLPPAAQGKLARRYQLRSSLSDLGGIVTDGEDFLLP